MLVIGSHLRLSDRPKALLWSSSSVSINCKAREDFVNNGKGRITMRIKSFVDIPYDPLRDSYVGIAFKAY